METKSTPGVAVLAVDETLKGKMVFSKNIKTGEGDQSNFVYPQIDLKYTQCVSKKNFTL